MNFMQALTALIDQTHADTVRYHYGAGGFGTLDTRDVTAASDKNVRIAVEVMGESGLGDEFYKEEDKLDFGTFQNCREYGMTVTVGGWTFAAYEHRNSDDICIEGCPADEVREFGPYGSEDKFDVLFSAPWKQYHIAAAVLVLAARHVIKHPDATRADLKRVVNPKRRRPSSA
jgi:hypothetical protein